MEQKQGKNYYFFLDETGDHSLSFIDESFPIFLLAGCLFEEESYKKVSDSINNFKEEFFRTKEVILHSRDIRKCDKSFQILFDLELKKSFYEKLNEIIRKADFKIIAVAIDKKAHIEKYGKRANDPYSLCLSYILERLVFCTDDGALNKIRIIIEKRGRKEDAQLLSHYNSIVDGRGTYHVSSQRFKERIIDFEMRLKKDNDIGLQISDLCAYPLARHILNTEEPYMPFEIIKDKVRKSPNGKVDGYGLKVFP